VRLLVTFCVFSATVEFCVCVDVNVLLTCLLYGLLMGFGRNLIGAVLTSAVSIGDGEGDDSSSFGDAGSSGIFGWFDASLAAVCNGRISIRPVDGEVLRRNGVRGLLLLPKKKGSMGGMLDGGISIEMSMLTGVVCEIVVLVLDVLGVEGVDGLTSIVVEVLMVVMVVGLVSEMVPVELFVFLCS
jgi:hypothetical protein